MDGAWMNQMMQQNSETILISKWLFDKCIFNSIEEYLKENQDNQTKQKTFFFKFGPVMTQQMNLVH